MSDGSSTPSPRPTPNGPRPGPAPQALPPQAPQAPQTPQPPQTPPPAEYSETLTAPAQIVTALAIAAVLAIVLIVLRHSLWPFAVFVFVAVGGTGIYLAGVSVTATRTYLEVGQGRGDRNPRRISNDEIVVASTAELTWGQVYGVGLPRADKTTRLTVRPGPTLVVELRTGEVVRVSCADPGQAVAVLGPH